MSESGFAVTFLVPPALKGGRDAERVFGCTYGLYPIPNLFILQAAAVLRREGRAVRFIDCPAQGIREPAFLEILRRDRSDALAIYSVNLSRADDLEALRRIREIRGAIPVVFFGPSPTYEPEAYL